MICSGGEVIGKAIERVDKVKYSNLDKPLEYILHAILHR